MTADTGSALVAAIVAAPEDDAPWLVYADWLQEAGRDAEAAAIRAHLPAIRDAVRVWHDVDGVLKVAADVSPADPAWRQFFGDPVPPHRPAPVVAPPPRSEVRLDPADREDTGSPRAPWWAVLLLANCLLGLFRGAMSRPPHLEDPSVPKKLKTIGTPVQPAVAAPSPFGSPRWDADEVSGFTLRQVDGAAEGRTYTFRADGTAVGGSRLDPDTPRRVWTWKVDDDGRLTLTAAGPRTVRLTKVRIVGELYEVERNGQYELYCRERP